MDKRETQLNIIKNHFIEVMDMTDEDIINCNNMSVVDVELEARMCRNCRFVDRCNQLEREAR